MPIAHRTVRANGIDIYLVMHDTREPVDRAETTEVVVVGAGPTGLTAAIRLAELGVPHVVLDAAAEPTRTSKAALVHASTLELLAGCRRGHDPEQHPRRPKRRSGVRRQLPTTSTAGAAPTAGRRAGRLRAPRSSRARASTAEACRDVRDVLRAGRRLLAKARRYGAAHRARLAQFHARGLLLLAGPLVDPRDGSAMGVFTSRQAAEEFIRGDPFVLHGVVRSWRVRTWDEFLTGPDDRTVSGDGGERGAAAAGAATGGG